MDVVHRYAATVKWISIGVIAVALFLLARSLPLGAAAEALGERSSRT